MIRMKAFFLDAFRMTMPIYSIGAGIVLLGVLAAVFAGPVLAFLRRWAMMPSLIAAAVCGLSILFMYPMRGILIGRALEHSEVGMGSLTKSVYLLGGGLLLGIFLLCVLTALRERLPGIKERIKTIERWDVLFLLVLLLVGNVIVWLYAKNSSTIYFWDNAGYWSIARQLAQQWQNEGLLSLLRSTYDSVLTQDYNYLIALPATAMARLFGESRYVFLAAIVNFAYFPLCILIWLTAKGQSVRPRLVTTAVLFALPLVLGLVVTGFVDVGGCIFTMAALMLWYADRGKNDFGRFLLVGVCLALAVLMRRWYAFYALAFVLALAVDGICFRRSGVPTLGALFAFAFSLLFFFQPLVSERLLADYGSMYEAYAMGLDRDIMLLLFFYGALVLAASLAVNIYLLCRRESRQNGVFLLIQTVLCFALFASVQTHGQQHLLLYVPAQVFLLLAGFESIQRLRREQAVAMTLALSLIPTLSPVVPRQQPVGPEDIHEIALLPSFTWKPPQRETAQEVVALIRRLDEFGAEGKIVGLLASSLGLNSDTLYNAEASLSLPRVSDVDRNAYLAYLPQVDQRDGWWDTLFYCDILVVADPVQLHLGEENQAVVNLPAKALLSGTGFAAAYEKMEEQWPIGDEITVYLYKKVREPNEQEQEALRRQFFALHPEAKYNGE